MFGNLMQGSKKGGATNTKISQHRRKKAELEELTMRMRERNRQNDIEKKEENEEPVISVIPHKFFYYIFLGKQLGV